MYCCPIHNWCKGSKEINTFDLSVTFQTLPSGKHLHLKAQVDSSMFIQDSCTTTSQASLSSVNVLISFSQAFQYPSASGPFIAFSHVGESSELALLLRQEHWVHPVHGFAVWISVLWCQSCHCSHSVQANGSNCHLPIQHVQVQRSAAKCSPSGNSISTP